MLAKCHSIHCVSPSKKLWSCSMKCTQDQSISEEQDCRVSVQYCCKLTSWLIHFSHPSGHDSDRSAQVKRSKDQSDQMTSRLTLWLNMSVSWRSCVYWQRCCRIISTLSTSSLSSSWTWRKTRPYFSWKLILKAQGKDNTQNVASQCDNTPGSHFADELCGCTSLYLQRIRDSKQQKSLQPQPNDRKGGRHLSKTETTLSSGMLQTRGNLFPARSFSCFVASPEGAGDRAAMYRSEGLTALGLTRPPSEQFHPFTRWWAATSLPLAQLSVSRPQQRFSWKGRRFLTFLLIFFASPFSWILILYPNICT